ncbi:MAG: hypothetical protein HY964_10405 [Ignavibacteriales bacterium]|nr:hypothetical protein [Ignavibacteriales bacterium]
MKLSLKFFILYLITTQFLVGQSLFLKNFLLSPTSNSSSLPPSNSVSHTLINNSSIFIGTGNGLAQSTDGARSWQSFVNDPSFHHPGIFAIAALDDTVWASIGYEKDVDGNGVQTGDGYAISYNSGLSWHFVSQTLDSQSDSLISYCSPGYPCINDSLKILPVIVPEQNVTFDISLSKGAVWIASWASGLRKSTDNGEHWQRIILPLDYMNSITPADTLYTFADNDSAKIKRIFIKYDPRKYNNLLAFSVYASNADTIWCGTADGVNRSTDGGISWVKMNHQNQSAPILGNWVIAIKEQRFSNISRIWTTNWRAQDNREEFGVSFTDDLGKTWKNRLHGIRAYSFAFRDSIAYIATENGIYRTEDGGETFTKFSDFIDPNSHHSIFSAVAYSVDVMGDSVYIGTNEGLVKTIDNADHPFGKDWIIFRTYAPLETKQETYAYPNPYAPSASLQSPDAYVRIHYGKKSSSSNTGELRNITIEIFDFSMNRVRTLINNAPRELNKEYDELWDGRDDSGNVVSNGAYFYTVKTNNDNAIYGKILVLQ